MKRQDKADIIEDLKVQFEKYSFFYVTDSSALTVGQVNELRRQCHEKDITLRVLKNTLIKKALEDAPEEKNFAPLFDSLKGPTAIMFTETSNAPAKLISEFRKTYDKPVLKAAYIDTDVFVGDDQIKVLKDLKSKEDLLGEVILLLQSPMKNVIGALQSGQNTLAGLVKTLSEREE